MFKENVMKKWVSRIREDSGIPFRLLLTLIFCIGFVFSQEYPKTVIENAKDTPVELIPFEDGPGFTVRNVSHREITHARFGCVVPGTTKGKTAKIRFDMDLYPLNLDISGPGSQLKFNGITGEQQICSRRDSAITILEVVFKGGKKWRLPHQTIDKNYQYKSYETCPDCIE
jgi:hypothetical protein